MELKKLSASAVHSADGCLARFQAQSENGYGGEIKNTAAMTGTAVHGALEEYVKNCIMKKVYPADMATLTILYQISFATTFSTSDRSRSEYADGLELCAQWFLRSTDPLKTEQWDEFEVLSTETKHFFNIPTSVGDIPFNYIFDRMDKMTQIGPHVYRVVDYKTNRAPESVESLHEKIQARCYALAAQIQFPDAEKVYVSFDMLRNGGLVETSFNRADNEETWNFLYDTAERIIAEPVVDKDGNRIWAPETLNKECNFCVRKSTCSELLKNQNMGGVFSAQSLDELTDLRALLKIQSDATKAAVEEIDKILKSMMENEDILDVQTDNVALSLKSSNYRTVDSERVFDILGEQLFSFYGGFNMTIGKVDNILKGDLASPEQKEAIKAIIRKSPGAPRVDTKLKKGLSK